MAVPSQAESDAIYSQNEASGECNGAGEINRRCEPMKQSNFGFHNGGLVRELLLIHPVVGHSREIRRRFNRQ
jgi:hypothetical protein